MKYTVIIKNPTEPIGLGADVVKKYVDRLEAELAKPAQVDEQLFKAFNETQRDLTILLGNIFASSQHDKNWRGMYDVVNGWITRNHKAIEAAEKLKEKS